MDVHQLGLNGTGVELGVLKGDFSEKTFVSSKLSRWVGVDLFARYEAYGGRYKTQSQFDSFRSMVERRYRRIGAELLVMDSAAAAGLFEDGSVDFVYVDANHDYDFVKKDIAAWWPKIRPGGLLAGHDYKLPGFPGVIRAVNEFVAAQAIPLHLTNDDFPSWIVQKQP